MTGKEDGVELIFFQKENFRGVEKNLFAAVKVLFISYISRVSYNIWLTMIVSKHLFL